MPKWDSTIPVLERAKQSCQSPEQARALCHTNHETANTITKACGDRWQDYSEDTAISKDDTSPKWEGRTVPVTKGAQKQISATHIPCYCEATSNLKVPQATTSPRANSYRNYLPMASNISHRYSMMSCSQDTHPNNLTVPPDHRRLRRHLPSDLPTRFHVLL
jgi:hypothetical protein